MGLVFKGIQKTTLIDFPRHVACTLFLSKCNFRCGYCYNTSLVLEQETGISLSEQNVFDFLEERKNFLDGVCITGGEPTLHSELPGFCKKIKEKGFLVKLDTNGTNPKMLEFLVKKNLVDFIAMDIKAPEEKYSKICGAKADLEKIKKSIELIKNSGIDYEFRTTLVPLLSEKDLLSIGELLKGSKKFVLQQFHKDMALLNPEFKKLEPYSKEKLEEFAEKLRPFFESIEIRA